MVDERINGLKLLKIIIWVLVFAGALYLVTHVTDIGDKRKTVKEFNYLSLQKMTKVELKAYLEDYLNKKYDNEFKLTLVSGGPEVYCSSGQAIDGTCIGKEIVTSVNAYRFKGIDKDGIEFELNYRDPYKHGNTTFEEMITDNYVAKKKFKDA